MLVILFGRVAVAAVYLAGLLFAGSLDAVAVTVAAAAVLAWLGRPAFRAVTRQRVRWTEPQQP